MRSAASSLNKLRKLPSVCLYVIVGIVLGTSISLTVLYNRSGRAMVHKFMSLAGFRRPIQNLYGYGTSPLKGKDSKSSDWEVQSPNHPQWKVRRGFDVVLVVKGFTYPVNIAFVPEPADNPDAPLFYINELHGTIKYVTRSGTVHIYATGLTNFKPISQTKSDETGLSGLMLVPASEDLLVTGSYLDKESGLLSNHILRLVSEVGGKTLKETQLLLNLKEFTSPSNQIQQILQGSDGKLYVSVGDAENPRLSRDLDRFGGKVLRLNFDGSAPKDNPFYDESNPQSPRSYVYAYGVRNIFDFDVHPTSGQLYATDNGKNIDRLIRLIASADYGWNGDKDSIRLNALYTWGPLYNVAPVGMTFLNNETLGQGSMGHLYVALYGPPAALGKNVAKSIVEFVVDPTTGLLKQSPETLIQYVGEARTTVLGVAEGPDGLYFTDFFGETASESTGTGAVWKVVPSETTLGLIANTDTGLQRMSQIDRGQALFSRNCAACHRVAGVGGHEGPELSHVASELEPRLSSPAYEATIHKMLKSNSSFLIQQRRRLEEVLKAKGEKRLRVWLYHHIEEPRFDNIYAKMPAFDFLSPNYRQDIIAFLMTLKRR